MTNDEAMARLDGVIERAESSLAELGDMIAEWKHHLAETEDAGEKARLQDDLAGLKGMAEQATRELAHLRLVRTAMTTRQYPDLTFAQVWDRTRTEAGATLH